MSRKGEAVLARVAAIARARGITTQALIVLWTGERFLHRLALSNHAEALVLKGGHLFGIWDGDDRRATADVDLGHDRDLTATELTGTLSSIAALNLDDGVAFDLVSNDIGNPSRGDTENPSTPATVTPRPVPVRVSP